MEFATFQLVNYEKIEFMFSLFYHAINYTHDFPRETGLEHVLWLKDQA